MATRVLRAFLADSRFYDICEAIDLGSEQYFFDFISCCYLELVHRKMWTSLDRLDRPHGRLESKIPLYRLSNLPFPTATLVFCSHGNLLRKCFSKHSLVILFLKVCSYIDAWTASFSVPVEGCGSTAELPVLRLRGSSAQITRQIFIGLQGPRLRPDYLDSLRYLTHTTLKSEPLKPRRCENKHQSLPGCQ